jgi:hypothetical protein
MDHAIAWVPLPLDRVRMVSYRPQDKRTMMQVDIEYDYSLYFML